MVLAEINWKYSLEASASNIRLAIVSSTLVASRGGVIDQYFVVYRGEKNGKRANGFYHADCKVEYQPIG